MAKSERKHWTELEKRRLREGLKSFGEDYDRLATYVGTRTALQIRSHILYRRTRYTAVRREVSLPDSSEEPIEVDEDSSEVLPRKERRPIQKSDADNRKRLILRAEELLAMKAFRRKEEENKEPTVAE